MAENELKKGLCGICPSGCGVEITMEREVIMMAEVIMKVTEMVTENP